MWPRRVDQAQKVSDEWACCRGRFHSSRTFRAWRAFRRAHALCYGRY
jgi:hypothetical protein